ncbi:MAG: hypothetical protein JWN95_31 [Frankiales bacterium]|nr:hypothetical protein [Frankiales bacterium]
MIARTGTASAAGLVRAIGISRLRDWPRLGARVPGIAVRAVVALLGALLSFVCYHQAFLIIVGLVITVFAVVLPRRLGAWALLLFLAASQLPRDHSPLDWQFLVLLAGLHLVHVLAAPMVEIPLRSWVQLAVFRPALLRYLAIQVPVQALAVLTLLLLAPRSDGSRHVSVPAVGIVGGAAFVVVTLLLAVPLLRERAR